MKIALLTTDNRECFRDYGKDAPWFGTAPAALMKGFAHLPEIEVHVVSCTQQPLKSPEKLADNIFFHSLLVPKIGWLRTGYQGCIRASRCKLREITPDIVHGQGTERDCSISAVFSGFPNVLTIHGNMRLIAQLGHSRPFTFKWLAGQLEGVTVPRSDGVVCITNYTREAMAPLAKKTWVVPNAVDDAFFEVKRTPSPTVTILCVAAIEARKNQNALIRAVEKLRPKINCELIFLGSANRGEAYADEFLQLVETRPWCRYVGFASRAELREHLATAWGLVLPSLEDNCPMVVLEAMAAGVPVAAARVGGVPEILRHNETGVLFDPLSEQDIATAMERLIENRDASLAARAQSEARKRFHPVDIAKRHLEIYEEVLSSRRH